MANQYVREQIDINIQKFRHIAMRVMRSDVHTFEEFFDSFMNYCQTDDIIQSISLTLKNVVIPFQDYWNDELKYPNGKRKFILPRDPSKKYAFLYQLCLKIYNKEFKWMNVGLEYFGSTYINENIRSFNTAIIEPLSLYIIEKMEEMKQLTKDETPKKFIITTKDPPFEITQSLQNFKNDHPESKKIAFIMMQFGESHKHRDILIAIRATLAHHDIIAHRADDKQYHDEVYYNILTYMHGCDFGIAVFDKIENESFNPNVSLEVGYMLALNKQVCLLKEKSLKALHTDLVGKHYRIFNINICDSSIDFEISQWLSDKGLNCSSSKECLS
jgi:hypothetical protein